MTHLGTRKMSIMLDRGSRQSDIIFNALGVLRVGMAGVRGVEGTHPQVGGGANGAHRLEEVDGVHSGVRDQAGHLLRGWRVWWGINTQVSGHPLY